MARHANSGDSIESGRRSSRRQGRPAPARSSAGRSAIAIIPTVSRFIRRFGPWLVGSAVAGVMLGPALAPGPLFNLDLILPPRIPVPRGVWGLGPELPRRVPLWAPVAWISQFLGGDTVGKLMMAAVIVVAFVGAYRFAMGQLATAPRLVGLGTVNGPSRFVGYGAGFLYAVNPFLLTRLDVGHFMIAVPMAFLPWVLPTLLAPGNRPRMTFLAALALGFSGHYGGAVTLVVVGAGLVATRGKNAGKVIGLTVLAQLPWLAPGLIVYGEGASIVDSVPFTTYIEGPQGAAQLLAGHGFWQPIYQVGYPGGWPVAIVGVLLCGMALYGAWRLPMELRGAMAALAALGCLAAVASATPGLADAYSNVSRNPIGSVVREGQRLLPLYLVWMAPAAALGAERLGAALRAGRQTPWRSALATVAHVAPVVAGVWLASTAIWGIDSKLRPVELPPEWEAAHQLILDNPGPVLALPWHQYFNLEADTAGVAAGNPVNIRRVLNPLPLYLGGDVLASSNPELDDSSKRERTDPRESQMDGIVADARLGRPVSDRVAKLGVRWIVLLHEVDWLAYSSLTSQSGLKVVLHAPALDLLEVAEWKGLVVDDRGTSVHAQPIVEPLLMVEPSGPAVYDRPAAKGWMRGLESAGATPEGLVALPPGAGVVWYWPSVVVLLATLTTYSAGVVAFRSFLQGVRRRRSDCSPEEATN